jgi:hypothetical protein
LGFSSFTGSGACLTGSGTKLKTAGLISSTTAYKGFFGVTYTGSRFLTTFLR